MTSLASRRLCCVLKGAGLAKDVLVLKMGSFRSCTQWSCTCVLTSYVPWLERALRLHAYRICISGHTSSLGGFSSESRLLSSSSFSQTFLDGLRLAFFFS